MTRRTCAPDFKQTSAVQPLAAVGKPAVIDSPTKAQTESAAAELMWAHFRDKKHLFIADVRLYRASILAALIAGASAEEAFKPFLKHASEVKPGRLPVKG